MVSDASFNSTSSDNLNNISSLIQSGTRTVPTPTPPQVTSLPKPDFQYETEVSKYVLPPSLLLIFFYIVVSCAECPRVRRMRRGIEAKKREARMTFVNECIVTKQVYSHDLAHIFEPSGNDAEEILHLPSSTSSSSKEEDLEVLEKTSHATLEIHDEESLTASVEDGKNNNVKLCLSCDNTYEGASTEVNEEEENSTAQISDCSNDRDHCNTNEGDEETGNSLPCCAICLEEYVIGEQVSWSRNAITSKKASSSRCDHVYHHQCISQWLVLHDDCPCCREKFMGDPKHQEKSSTNDNIEGSGDSNADIDGNIGNRGRSSRVLVRFFELWQKLVSTFTSDHQSEDQKEEYKFCVIHGLVAPNNANCVVAESSNLSTKTTSTSDNEKKVIPLGRSSAIVPTKAGASQIMEHRFAEV